MNREYDGSGCSTALKNQVRIDKTGYAFIIPMVR